MSSISKDYIINPNTMKPVKKGTRQYNLLMRQGLQEEELIDEKQPISKKKVMYKIKQEDTEDDIEMKKAEIDDELDEKEDESFQAVKGRGVHKDKLVKRFKPPPTNKVIKKTEKVIKDRKNKEDTSDYNELEKRILKLLESSDEEESDNED